MEIGNWSNWKEAGRKQEQPDRGGRTRSNGKCSKKVAMMDKDLNGNWSNGKCPNWKQF